MDTTPTAGQTPAAAHQSEAEAFLSAGGGFDRTVNRATQPQEQAPEPQSQAAPVAIDTPESQQQQAPVGANPDAATTQTPESNEALNAQIAEMARIKAERDVLAEQTQRWEQANLMAQRQEQARQIEQMRQERVQQAQAVAENMIRSGDTEGGLAYIRRFNDEARVADWQAAQSQIAQTKQMSEQQVHRALAPQYAKHLVATHGLPEAYVRVLSQYDGNTQDRMVQDLVATHQQTVQQQTARESELEQRLRDLEASLKAQNPAFNPGGTGGATGQVNPQRPTNPREAEIWDYQNAAPFTR